MELADVDLDEKPRPPRTVSVSSHPNPLAIKRGSALSPKSRPASVQVQETSDLNQSRNEIDQAAEQLQDVEIDDKPRPPRALSVNPNPNPLAIRRGSAVAARSQSPKPTETPNPESSDYSSQLRQFLEEEPAEPVAESSSATEEEEKPRAPRTISIASNAANPLAQRRGSSVRASLRPNQPEKLPEEASADASENLLEGSAEQNTPPVVPGPVPPPLPSSPAPGDEDMVRPSISLSFGGLYDIRPSMIETEYVSDLPEREYREPMPVIRESESDNIYEDMYDIRGSTIAIERPAPPVPPVPPPAAPSTPPPPVPKAVPPPPTSPPPSEEVRVSMSYDSDSDDHPLSATNYTSSTTSTATNSHSAATTKPSSTTYSANTTTFSTVPLHYPTPAASAVEMTSLAWKLCPSVTIVWQERYFVLKKDGSIHYYSDKDTYLNNFAPRGVICISDIQRVQGKLFVELQLNKLNIGVNSKNSRVYKLKFGTAEEAKKWYDAIHKYARV